MEKKQCIIIENIKYNKLLLQMRNLIDFSFTQMRIPTDTAIALSFQPFSSLWPISTVS
jgi:hypothetical protein